MTKCDGLDLLDSLAEATYKIGDIAFVKEEAEKGKTIPVMITGVDYDVNAASDGRRNNSDYKQMPEYRTQLVDIRFDYDRHEPRAVIKRLVIDDCRCYDENELVSEEEAERIGNDYIQKLHERIDTLIRLHDATKRALAWPDSEMPVTVEDGHVKFLAVNQETGF